MINIEKLQQIAKPRSKKSLVKVWFRRTFRKIITLYQDFYLWLHSKK